MKNSDFWITLALIVGTGIVIAAVGLLKPWPNLHDRPTCPQVWRADCEAAMQRR